MNQVRPCGCKGIRTCLLCENEYGIPTENLCLDEFTSYVYCPWCNKAWSGWNANSYKSHPNHEGKCIEFPGVFIKVNFLSQQESKCLMDGIDGLPWSLSQSGRRKQNFGPKCNFKKRQLKVGNFNGFPLFSKFVQEKFKDVPILENYKTIEQCTLEYDPRRGASIDPHIDDCWVWGERIVTVNILSDSVLSLTPYYGSSSKYNLNCHDGDSFFSKEKTIELEDSPKNLINPEKVVVRVPMPSCSLLVIYGAARYEWEHFILRKDITERRVCFAYREFTTSYLPGGKHDTIGTEILKISGNFWEKS